MLAAGQVGSLDDDFGQVRGRAPDGHLAVVDLPARMLLMRGVHAGADLWVVSRMLGTSALVEVDPAIQVALPAALAKHFEWARVSASASLDSLDTLLADESEADAAARYESTVALMPPSDYWDDLLAEAKDGRLPVRHLHPIG